jgi:predicted ATP-grasp superfamily ATP-dependent carboligase
MNGQKQSRLDNLEKRMAATTNVIQQVINELSYLKNLSIGTLETIKNMEGYEQAIEKLKEKMVAESGKAKEADTSRKVIE